MNNLKDAKEWLSTLIQMRNYLESEIAEEPIKIDGFFANMYAKKLHTDEIFKSKIALCAVKNAIIDAKLYFVLYYTVFGGDAKYDYPLERKIDVNMYSFGLLSTTITTKTVKF